MFLQLAEGENNGNYQALAESPLDNYVFVPAGFLPEFTTDTYLRADYFANNYDTATANALINALASRQQMSEGVVETALNFVPGVGPIASKGLSIAKNLIAQRQAKVQAGTAKPIGKPGGFLDKLRQKVQGSQTKKTEIPPFDVTANIGGAQGGISFQPKPTDDQMPTFWQKYKTPILIGGGALVLIGGIYMFTRKKKR